MSWLPRFSGARFRQCRIRVHNFVPYRTALDAQPVGHRWPALILGLPACDLRTARILDEVHATGGDVRRSCDLCGLSIDAALRDTAVLDPPGVD